MARVRIEFGDNQSWEHEQGFIGRPTTVIPEFSVGDDPTDAEDRPQAPSEQVPGGIPARLTALDGPVLVTWGPDPEVDEENSLRIEPGNPTLITVNASDLFSLMNATASTATVSGLATEATADRIADAVEGSVINLPPMDAEKWDGPNEWEAHHILITGAGADTIGAAESGMKWIVGDVDLSFSAACTLTIDDCVFTDGTADYTTDLPGACKWPPKGIGGVAMFTIAVNNALIIRNSAANMKGIVWAKKVPA